MIPDTSFPKSLSVPSVTSVRCFPRLVLARDTLVSR
jgi:hypothetical protein